VALLLGAAHPEGPRASAPQELAAYALPGGELPYLCGTPAREPSAPDDHGHAACLAACLATVPAALPGAGPEPPPARGAYRSRLPGQAADARPRTRWTASRARAPPLV
jgi:hypothetical protein